MYTWGISEDMSAFSTPTTTCRFKVLVVLIIELIPCSLHSHLMKVINSSGSVRISMRIRLSVRELEQKKIRNIKIKDRKQN